jgi:O-methyltransferase
MSKARKLVRSAYRWVLGPLYLRIQQLENEIARLQGLMRNNRFKAVEEVADYLYGAEIPGDYLEFGVYKGVTFAHACTFFSYYPQHKHMRFFALDSFEGLPQPKGFDAVDGYTATFYEGQFACTEKDFIENLRREGVDLDRVRTVKGWFSESLTDEMAARHGIDKVAAAWIDCDLYESTIPILRFLTPKLVTGSVLIFDDWRCFHNLPTRVEQRALNEWRAENPHITLHRLIDFGWHGIAFTVELNTSVADAGSSR